MNVNVSVNVNLKYALTLVTPALLTYYVASLKDLFLGPLLFLLYINDLPQVFVSNLLLYADDTCIVFQHKSIIEIEKQLIRDFSSLFDWFVDNKLSIHLGKDKTKSNLFGAKHKLRNAKS